MSKDWGVIGMPHPECRDDEIFISNVTAQEFVSQIGWETKRRGETPYDQDGNKVPRPDLYPVFAKRAELEKKHPGFQRQT